MKRWAVWAILAAAPAALYAQDITQAGAGAKGPSPIDDKIAHAKDALNSLRYDEARQSARELFALGGRLRRSQQISTLQLAAAAFYPEEESGRNADSARVYLTQLSKYYPEGSMPADITWRGLDSLLNDVRRQTFGATIKPPQQLTLSGTTSRPAVEVFSTKLARWQLYLVPQGGGVPTLLDTLPLTRSGRLAMRAHDGHAAVIQPGTYEVRVLAISEDQSDTITTKLDMMAEGIPPTLVDMPTPLDTTKFQKERAGRAFGTAIAGGIIMGGATWALAQYARSLEDTKPFGKSSADNRSMKIGIAIGVGALAGAFLDPGRPDPEAKKANVAARNDYMKKVGEATEENRKRIADLRVTLTFLSDTR